MQSSIGHAHWTVELECDTLFITETNELDTHRISATKVVEEN